MPEVKAEEITAPQLSPPSKSFCRQACPPQTVSAAVIGPFTLRDILVIGCSVAIFAVSLIPSQNSPGTRWFMMWSDTNCVSGLVYVGAVLAVGGLFLIRRIAPQLSWAQRIGSFSTDQLASIVAVYSAIDWFSKMVVFLYRDVSRFGAGYSNVAIASLGFFLAIFYVIFTVGSPSIPHLRNDFDVRPEESAHRVARVVAPAVRLQRPTATPMAITSGLGTAGALATVPEPDSDSGAAPRRQAEEPAQNPEYEPFWFAVAREAEVIDQRSGRPFVLKTGLWYLALKDLGSKFLVTDRNSLSQEKNPTKRGILENIEGVERA